MNKVAIFSVPTASGDLAYHAMVGNKHSHGKTAGEALDALTALLPKNEAGSLVVVQTRLSDRLLEGLTRRELEVLDLIAEGLRQKEIASRLAISPATVSRHVHRIHARLRAGSRLPFDMLLEESRGKTRRLQAQSRTVAAAVREARASSPLSDDEALEIAVAETRSVREERLARRRHADGS